MKKIAIAVDSFKGSLTSREVAETFEAGVHDLCPDCQVRKVVIADGGEGTTEALVEHLGGERVEIEVHDPLHRKIKSHYYITKEGTAIMDIASTSGLTLLKEEERNPMFTSTYGSGEIILDAAKRGCRNFLIGIGGSATNDAGTGMLRALGFRFIDCDGQPLIGGGEILERIVAIDDSEVNHLLRDCKFTIACDVTNPLYGEQGAAYVFAPQKGATDTMVAQLDRGLRNFARVAEKFCCMNIGGIEGAGAAGGLGGGFYALLNARLVRGIEMMLEAIGFSRIIEGCNLVITGEGCIDRQTVMGKAPSGILKVAKEQNIPTIAIGGAIKWCEELRESGFTAIEIVTPEGMSKEEAMRPATAKENVRRAAQRIAKEYL